MSGTKKLARVAMMPKGVYSDTAQYKRLDIVRYSNSTWLCKQECSGIAPVEGAYWMKIVADGGGGVAQQVNQQGMVYFASTSDMVEASAAFRKGMVVQTAGFYSAGDGGGAQYLITDVAEKLSGEDAPSNHFCFALENDLYASIILDGDVNIMQLGAIPVTMFGSNCTASSDGSHKDPNYKDSKENFEAYVALCKVRDKIYKLVLPSGHFFMSPTYLAIGDDRGVVIEGNGGRSYGNRSVTFIHAIEPSLSEILDENGNPKNTDRSQDYIWCISGQRNICTNETKRRAGGVHIKGICFDGMHGGANDTYNYYSPKVALLAVDMADSYFDDLAFKYIKGSAIALSAVQETTFNHLSFQYCGGLRGNRIMPALLFASLNGDNGLAKNIFKRTSEDYVAYSATRNCSADYFGYINAEGMGGSIIHADETSGMTHCEIGNIQWEGTFYFGSPEASETSYGYKDPKTAAMDVKYCDGWSPSKSTYANEVEVICGAFSGHCHDLTIHAITQTWGTNSYCTCKKSIDTLFRVKQLAAIVTNPSGSNSFQYHNVRLMDYHSREDGLPMLYMKGVGTMHESPFTYGSPIKSGKTPFRVYNAPTPVFSLHGYLNSDRYFPALRTHEKSGNICSYEPSASAPCGLVVANSGSFAFRYQKSKRYIASVKFKQYKDGVIKGNNTSPFVYFPIEYRVDDAESTTKLTYKPELYGEYFMLDLKLHELNCTDNGKIVVYLSDGIYIDYIRIIDDYVVNSEVGKAEDKNWVGRMAYDNGALVKCTKIKRTATYKLVFDSSTTISAGNIVLTIDGVQETITFSESEAASISTVKGLLIMVRNKFNELGYAASYFESQRAVYIVQKSLVESSKPVVTESNGRTITTSVATASILADTWEAASGVSLTESDYSAIADEVANRFVDAATTPQ